MKIQVRTELFSLAHGKQPRGFGSWAFAVNKPTGELLWVHGKTFAEAKKEAKALAPAGTFQLFVCS